MVGINLSTTLNAIVILPEIEQHAKEVLGFFKNFIIDDGNLDLLLGNASLNVLLEHV